MKKQPPAPAGDAPLTGEPPARNTALAKAQQMALLQALHTAMLEKKYYRDVSLSLQQLARVTGFSRSAISNVLNHCKGETFYAFINHYRVQDIIAQLDKCKLNKVVPNILSLAAEAGFKSKSSFNLYFKKIAGCTPSEYLHLHNGQAVQ